MADGSREKKEFEELDALTGRSPRKLFSLSPNDVLVQISLPLVLILAIATRLMMIGQSIASVDNGPIILDLWKQQLILRVDHVLAEWERESGLASLPSFDRVRWQQEWPDDNAFRHLCAEGQALADLDALRLELYRKALQPPSSIDAEDTSFSFIQELYDPLESDPSVDPDTIPSDFQITPERRAYAMTYIAERCLKWRAEVEDLQWETIDQIMTRLPAEEDLTDRRLQIQMKNIAAALSERGYPLLPSVANEYGGTD